MMMSDEDLRQRRDKATDSEAENRNLSYIFESGLLNRLTDSETLRSEMIDVPFSKSKPMSLVETFYSYFSLTS